MGYLKEGLWRKKRGFASTPKFSTEARGRTVEKQKVSGGEKSRIHFDEGISGRN